MNEDIDDDDDEDDVILDRQTLNHSINNTSSNSHRIRFDLNQSNFGIDNDSTTLSKEKTVILAVTCISIVCDYNLFFFFS